VPRLWLTFPRAYALNPLLLASKSPLDPKDRAIPCEQQRETLRLGEPTLGDFRILSETRCSLNNHGESGRLPQRIIRTVISRTLKVLGILGVAAICSSQASRSWVLRQDGIGPVKVGMNLAQLNAVLHEKFTLPEDKDEQDCFIDGPTAHPQVSFMILKGRLARIEVNGPGVPTENGIQVGNSEERARQVYGSSLKVKQHAYTGPQGHYLTIRSADGRYGIRFETDNGKITTFYGGRFDAIQYIVSFRQSCVIAKLCVRP